MFTVSVYLNDENQLGFFVQKTTRINNLILISGSFVLSKNYD